MLRRHSPDSKMRARRYDALFQQTHIVSRREFVRPQIDDGICDQLTRPMKRSLSSPQCLDELCFPAMAQILLLFGRDLSDFAPAAGVYVVELAGYDGWWWSWEVGGRFGCKELGDQ